MKNTLITNLCSSLWDEVFNKIPHPEWDNFLLPKWTPNQLLLLGTIQALHKKFTIVEMLLKENLCLGYKGEFIGYFGMYDFCLYVLSNHKYTKDTTINKLAGSKLDQLYSLICLCRTKQGKVLIPGSRIYLPDDKSLHIRAGYALNEPIKDLREKWLPRLRQWSDDNIWPPRNPYRPLMGLVLMIRDGYKPNPHKLSDVRTQSPFHYKRTVNGYHAYVTITAPNNQIPAVSEIFDVGTYIAKPNMDNYRIRELQTFENQNHQLISTGRLQSVKAHGAVPFGPIIDWNKVIPSPKGKIIHEGYIDNNGPHISTGG